MLSLRTQTDSPKTFRVENVFRAVFLFIKGRVHRVVSNGSQALKPVRPIKLVEAVDISFVGVVINLLQKFTRSFGAISLCYTNYPGMKFYKKH